MFLRNNRKISANLPNIPSRSKYFHTAAVILTLNTPNLVPVYINTVEKCKHR